MIRCSNRNCVAPIACYETFDRCEQCPYWKVAHQYTFNVASGIVVLQIISLLRIPCGFGYSLQMIHDGLLERERLFVATQDIQAILDNLILLGLVSQLNFRYKTTQKSVIFKIETNE